MAFKDWVDRYIISLPKTQQPQTNVVDVSKVQLQTTNATMGDLSVGVKESDVKSAAGAGVDVAFEKIYEAARIPIPEHKFTVEKIGEMLQNPKLAKLAPEGKAAAVLVALDAQGIKIDGIIEETVKKDKALDIFEKVQRDQAKQFGLQKEDENKKLAQEIEAFTREKQKQIESNKKAVSDREKQLAAWLNKKGLKETELHNIIQHFTTDNPISETSQAQTGTVKITDLTQGLNQ